MKNKTYLIFGATSGLGWQVTRFLFAGGNNVCAFGRRLERLNGLRALLCKTPAENKRYFHYRGDVSIREDVEGFIKTSADKFDSIAGAVNCCGIFKELAIGENLEDWERLMDINFWGNYYILESLLDKNFKSQSMFFVAITSSLAKGGVINNGPYAVSKAALNALIATARKEVPMSKLLTFAIQPRPFKSEMNKNAINRADKLALKLCHFLKNTDKFSHGEIIKL